MIEESIKGRQQHETSPLAIPTYCSATEAVIETWVPHTNNEENDATEIGQIIQAKLTPIINKSVLFPDFEAPRDLQTYRRIIKAALEGIAAI